MGSIAIYVICCLVVLAGLISLKVYDYYKEGSVTIQNWEWFWYIFLLIISPITIAACIVITLFVLSWFVVEGIATLFVKICELEWWNGEITIERKSGKEAKEKETLDDYTINAGGFLIKD